MFGFVIYSFEEEISSQKPAIIGSRTYKEVSAQLSAIRHGMDHYDDEDEGEESDMGPPFHSQQGPSNVVLHILHILLSSTIR